MGHPGVRADEQPDPRDEEEPEGAGPGPQGGADHHLGHGGPLKLALLRPGAALGTVYSWRLPNIIGLFMIGIT